VGNSLQFKYFEKRIYISFFVFLPAYMK